ncbi:hypothetical protein [Desulfovibrio gilichinskyi]|uniref:Uncharacterized protein n=1 Tax=Desulfovibrio gilichinskyi TaxID=1519643 RepID=A0A1X7C0L7_9BACT|nr:hypothetical protein [Desulfovibrio gilichinskyi]SME87844.1 hypothetical protein SAMN06295933_0055 [Desulfovibrio gilichinskyi]
MRFINFIKKAKNRTFDVDPHGDSSFSGINEGKQAFDSMNERSKNPEAPFKGINPNYPPAKDSALLGEKVLSEKMSNVKFGFELRALGDTIEDAITNSLRNIIKEIDPKIYVHSIDVEKFTTRLSIIIDEFSQTKSEMESILSSTALGWRDSGHTELKTMVKQYTKTIILLSDSLQIFKEVLDALNENVKKMDK